MDLARRNIPHLPSIKGLKRLAYKKIFDKLTYTEELMLEKGLKFYPLTDLKVREIDELISINQMLVDNEQGKYGEMKEKMVRFNLDYREIYGLN